MLPNVITPRSIAFPFHHYDFQRQQCLNVGGIRELLNYHSTPDHINSASFFGLSQTNSLLEEPSEIFVGQKGAGGDFQPSKSSDGKPSVMNVLPCTAVVKTEPNVLSPSPHHRHHHHHHHHHSGEQLSPVLVFGGGGGSPCTPSTSPTNIPNTSSGTTLQNNIILPYRLVFVIPPLSQ